MTNKTQEPADPAVDIEALFRLLDIALASNDPNIKDALRNLLVITALFTANTPPAKAIAGPLSEILTKLNTLASRISTLEAERSSSQKKASPWKEDPWKEEAWKEEYEKYKEIKKWRYHESEEPNYKEIFEKLKKLKAI